MKKFILTIFAIIFMFMNSISVRSICAGEFIGSGNCSMSQKISKPEHLMFDELINPHSKTKGTDNNNNLLKLASKCICKDLIIYSQINDSIRIVNEQVLLQEPANDNKNLIFKESSITISKNLFPVYGDLLKYKYFKPHLKTGLYISSNRLLI